MNNRHIIKFLKKTDVIKYKNKNISLKKLLFQEDISNNGKKCFYYVDPIYIYNIIKNKYESNFYEFWDINDNICFSIDLDIKIKEFNKCINLHLIKIINNVIQGAQIKYNYKYEINDIIILESNIINKKYSYHIIFKGLVFENYLGTKEFFNYLVTNYDMYGCDNHIYNLTCLRTCFCSKMGKLEILLPKKLLINDESTYMPDNDIQSFWLNTLLTYNIKINKLIICNEKNNKSRNINKYISDDSDLKDLLFKLPSKYYDDYHYWISIGMILYSISNNNFDLWNEWSKLSIKYDENIMMTKWKSFNNNQSNKLTYGTLYKWFIDENIIKKKPINIKVDEYPIKEITISDKYKITDIYDLINKSKLDSNDFNDRLNKKLFAIQSEKGTGKTKNLLDSMFINNDMTNKNILFVSSRRTFGIKLLSDLKIYGFELYSEIKEYYISHNKIICQIDSLLRLDLEYFDYIIVDECESLARYMTSIHFIKNNKANLIINTFELLLSEAKHVYIMDADLSDRCMNYYINIIKPGDDMKILINDYKYYDNYTIRYMRYVIWLDEIIKKVKTNKLCIPMASNNKAKDLYTKLKQEYINKNILLINKETDDKEKMDILIDLNKIWLEYDVIIYTPSVCMGVSFDIPDYFDYIYVYGCVDSLGSQEFCQMIHRVRNPKNKIINLTLDNYKDYNKEDLIDYNDVENILVNDYYLTYYELHNNIISTKLIRDSNDKKIITYPYKDEPIYDLYVRNAKEIIEDKLNFSSNLFGYFKYKNYKLEFYDNIINNDILLSMKNIRENRLEKENEDTIDGIMNAPILSKEEYIEKIKFKSEYLNNDDINAIKKYNFINCYKLDDISRELVEEYYNNEKMRWYKNITTIMSTEKRTTEEKLIILKDNEKSNKIISNCYIDFTSKNKYTYHYYPITIINKLDFNINDLSIRHNEEHMKNKMNDTINFCKDYSKDIAYKYNIKMINNDLNKLSNIKDQIKYINIILNSQYGFKIKKIKNNIYGLMNENIWDKIKLKPLELNSIINLLDNNNLDYIKDIDMFID